MRPFFFLQRWMPAVSAALALAAPAGARVEVRGTVEVRGGPAEAAMIEAMPLAGAWADGVGLLAERQAEPAAAARCDGDGRYSLELPEAGVWRLVARAPGRLPMQLRPLVLSGSRELPPVSLRRAYGVEVRLVDGDGRPVPGARVSASQSGDPRLSGWRTDRRAGRTDARGRLVLPRAEGEELELTVLAPGAAVVRTALADGVVRVQPAPTRLRIEVRGATGPLAEVLVFAAGVPVGLTGADGRLAVPLAAGGEADLVLLSPDGRRHAVRPRPASGGEEGVLAIEMPPPIVLSGRVVRQGGRRGVAGAVVWSSLDPGSFTRSDADGRYRFLAPDPGRFWIQAEAAGHLPAATWLTPPEVIARRAPTLVLEPSAAARGQVVDVAGRPLAGVGLVALRRAGSRVLAFRPDDVDARATSSAQGEFHLTGLAPGRAYTVQARLAGFAEARLEVTADAATTTSAKLVLQAARGVFGRVLDEAEQPVAGAEAILSVAGRRSLPAPSRSRREIDGDPARALSDTDGLFTLAEAPAGEVDLTVYGPGLAPATVRGIEVPPGTRPLDLGTVVLSPGARVVGRAVDRRGEGVEGAEVVVLRHLERLDSLPPQAEQRLLRREPDAVTGADGAFEVKGLAPGEKVHLFVHGPGHAPAWLEGLTAPSGDGGATVVLEPGWRIAGVVVDEAGDPVAGAEVVLTQQDLLRGAAEFSSGAPRRRQTSTGREGSFEFPDLRPGRLTVSASAYGFAPVEPLRFELPGAAGADRLEIVLRRGHTLRGQVLTRSGEAVAGMKLSADGLTASTDGEGLYLLAGIPQGPRRVEAYHPHYGRRLEEVVIEPGSNTLDLVLEDGYEVRGRTVDPQGRPVAGAQVELREGARRGERRHRVVTTADGAFRVHPVTPGDYRVGVSREGFARLDAELPVRVSDASVEGLEIVLEPGIEVTGRILGLDFDEAARVRVRATDAQGFSRDGQVRYDGRYEITDLGPGDWKLRASLASGRREARAWIRLERGTARAGQDLEFENRLRFSGWVTYDGEPLAGTLVSLEGHQRSVSRSVTTGHDGEFVIEDLAPGTYRFGLANPREHLAENREVVLDADRRLDVDLRSARLGGRVLEAGSDLPVALAHVELRRIEAGGSLGSKIAAGSNDEGLFVIPRVPEGSYQLRVGKDGYAPAEQRLDVLGGIDVEDLEPRLRATEGLDLSVRLASGRIPGFIDASVFDDAGRQLLHQSRPLDAAGRAHLPSIPPGRWELVVGAPGGVTTRLAVSVPSEPVTIELADAGRLHVRVPDLAASELVGELTLADAGARPFLGLGEDGHLRRRWPMAEGFTRVEGVPEGLWVLEVRSPDGKSWSTTAVVTAAALTEVVLE